MMFSRAIVLGLAVVLGGSITVLAQDVEPRDGKDKPTEVPAGTPENAAPADVTTQEEDDPDLDPNPAQPDFTVVALPTTLRVPRHKAAFRVTHRFGRPLGSGDFGDLVQDLFGLDAGAQIGLEFRFGLLRRTQVGIHRTSDRTIEFFAQYDLVQQGDDGSFGLAILGTAEGTNNFRDSRTPGVGVILSREFGEQGAVYAMPMWLNNTNLLPADLVDDNDTFLIGLAARFRIRPTVYLVGEYTPRVAGYNPQDDQASFGIEKRAGGHLFQLNFSNGLGTTMGQLARGGFSFDDWFIGFNISRKFF